MAKCQASLRSLLIVAAVSGAAAGLFGPQLARGVRQLIANITASPVQHPSRRNTLDYFRRDEPLPPNATTSDGYYESAESPLR